MFITLAASGLLWELHSQDILWPYMTVVGLGHFRVNSPRFFPRLRCEAHLLFMKSSSVKCNEHNLEFFVVSKSALVVARIHTLRNGLLTGNINICPSYLFPLYPDLHPDAEHLFTTSINFC